MAIQKPTQINGNTIDEIKKSYSDYLASTDLPTRCQDIKDRLDVLVDDVKLLKSDIHHIKTDDDIGVAFWKALSDIGVPSYSPKIFLNPEGDIGYIGIESKAEELLKVIKHK